MEIFRVIDRARDRVQIFFNRGGQVRLKIFKRDRSCDREKLNGSERNGPGAGSGAVARMGWVSYPYAFGIVNGWCRVGVAPLLNY